MTNFYSILSAFHQCPLCERDTALHMGICASCVDQFSANQSRCKRCAHPLPISTRRCGFCQHLNHIDASYAPFIYEGEFANLVGRFKSNKGAAMAKGLAHWFWEQESISTLPHALVPVPSKTPSLRQRGFSPALQLAKTLSRLSGVPLHHHHQDRHLLQLVQKNQSRAQRRKAKGSDFFIRHKPPGHVAIVDDVMTTGGTVDALAQQLKKLGAKQVDVWVFARTPKQR